MGPENKNEYMVYRDGVPLGGAPVAWGEIKPAEIMPPPETMEPVGGFTCQCVDFTLTIKAPKRWRCRGRKRFIKLMMSEGIGRNYAQWLAEFVQGWVCDDLRQAQRAA